MEPKPRPEFEVHILNDFGVIKAKAMAEHFALLMDFLESAGMCMPGRELSIAKTKLEEACFYARKAMSINLVNQKSQVEVDKE